jgi:hypothetical protein
MFQVVLILLDCAHGLRSRTVSVNPPSPPFTMFPVTEAVAAQPPQPAGSEGTLNALRPSPPPLVGGSEGMGGGDCGSCNGGGSRSSCGGEGCGGEGYGGCCERLSPPPSPAQPPSPAGSEGTQAEVVSKPLPPPVDGGSEGICGDSEDGGGSGGGGGRGSALLPTDSAGSTSGVERCRRNCCGKSVTC